MARCLIGYLSKTGTTEEIAYRIGFILKGMDIETDVRTIDKIDTFDDYDSVILGCPINAMRHLPEFVSFVREKGAGISAPVDLFTVSYMAVNGRKIWQNAINKSVASLDAYLKPESTAIFGGRIASRLPAPARFIFGLPNSLPLDLRDWNQIEAWTRNIGERILKAGSVKES